MCIAIPGLLLERDGARGKVDMRGYVMPVELGIVDADPGDYLLVHAGCAISVMTQDEAQETLELLALVEQYAHEND